MIRGKLTEEHKNAMRGARPHTNKYFLDIDIISDLYVNKNKTTGEIGTQFDVPREVVYKRLRKHGVHLKKGNTRKQKGRLSS